MTRKPTTQRHSEDAAAVLAEVKANEFAASEVSLRLITGDEEGWRWARLVVQANWMEMRPGTELAEGICNAVLNVAVRDVLRQVEKRKAEREQMEQREFPVRLPDDDDLWRSWIPRVKGLIGFQRTFEAWKLHGERAVKSVGQDVGGRIAHLVNCPPSEARLPRLADAVDTATRRSAFFHLCRSGNAVAATVLQRVVQEQARRMCSRYGDEGMAEVVASCVIGDLLSELSSPRIATARDPEYFRRMLFSISHRIGFALLNIQRDERRRRKREESAAARPRRTAEDERQAGLVLNHTLDVLRRASDQVERIAAKRKARSLVGQADYCSASLAKAFRCSPRTIRDKAKRGFDRLRLDPVLREAAGVD